MLDGKQHSRRRAAVAIVYQDTALLEEVAVAFQRQVDHGIQQGMAGTYERRQRLAGRR